LEKSTAHLAAEERGLSKEICGLLTFGESQRIQFVIHCFAWLLSARLFRMTLPP